MSDSRAHNYRVVDVFTRRSLEGNPLAVFLDGSGLSDQVMQKIARELNLSETVFLMPPARADCAARFRIFTPLREIPFAGHPTVGASFVLLDEGMVPKDIERFSVEELVGPVPVRVERAPVEEDGGMLIWLTTPPIQTGPVFPKALCSSVLQLETRDVLDIEPQLLTAGNPTLFVAVRDPAAVDRARFDAGSMAKLKGAYPEPFCVFVFAPVEKGAYSRMFAPEYGVPEDPATGSSTGPLAAYMMRHGLVSGAAGTRFISEQGTRMQRKSLLHVLIRGERGAEGIEVGGHVASIANGVMYVPGE